MAENKNAIIVYADWIDKFEELEDDEAGRLIKHFFRYVNDLNPIAPDRITKLSFIDIENSLKRDLKKWEKTIEGRSKAGKASAEARKLSKQNSTNSTNVDFDKQNSTNSTDSVSDSVTVNDSDSVNDNDILLKKETKEYTPNGVVDLSNQPNVPKIDFNNMISFFNANRGVLPEVKKLTKTRENRILALQKQHGKKSIQIAIEKTRDSDFLQGGNKEGWVASFDWIFKPANFLKILEDNYVNRENTRSIHSSRTDDDLKKSAVTAVNAMFGLKNPPRNRNR